MQEIQIDKKYTRYLYYKKSASPSEPSQERISILTQSKTQSGAEPVGRVLFSPQTYKNDPAEVRRDPKVQAGNEADVTWPFIENELDMSGVDTNPYDMPLWVEIDSNKLTPDDLAYIAEYFKYLGTQRTEIREDVPLEPFTKVDLAHAFDSLEVNETERPLIGTASTKEDFREGVTLFAVYKNIQVRAGRGRDPYRPSTDKRLVWTTMEDAQKNSLPIKARGFFYWADGTLSTAQSHPDSRMLSGDVPLDEAKVLLPILIYKSEHLKVEDNRLLIHAAKAMTEEFGQPNPQFYAEETKEYRIFNPDNCYKQYQDAYQLRLRSLSTPSRKTK
jgi:hypothetical protein